jgi:hypothetical protein
MKCKYKYFYLIGRKITKNSLDGREYRVKVLDKENNLQFRQTVGVTGTCIGCGKDEGGFEGDQEAALEKVKELAFEKSKKRIDTGEYELKNDYDSYLKSPK